MAMEPFEFGAASPYHQFGFPGDNPPHKLVRVVMQLGYLLGELITDDDYANVFYAQMLPSIRRIWPTELERFSPYAGAVSNANLERLEEHGLTGAALEFKLEAINFVAGRFFELFAKAFGKAKKGLVLKLLAIIDRFWKSLLDAVPGGGAAIREFKEMCESLIDDEDYHGP